MQEIVQKYLAWAREVQESGRLKGSQKLKSGVGRVIDGRRGGAVLDGPYAETKEVIGGYWILEADTIDEATQIASGIPFGEGTLEIRPFDDDAPRA
jgi:hypothetical protein